jgi:hypothetical protein
VKLKPKSEIHDHNKPAKVFSDPDFPVWLRKPAEGDSEKRMDKAI